MFIPIIIRNFKFGFRETDTPVEPPCIPPQPEPKEEKGKTFSPSVEFKKLDVADESKASNTMEPLPSIFDAKPRASTDVFFKGNGPKEAIPSTTTQHYADETTLEFNFGKIFTILCLLYNQAYLWLSNFVL